MKYVKVARLWLLACKTVHRTCVWYSVGILLLSVTHQPLYGEALPASKLYDATPVETKTSERQPIAILARDQQIPAYFCVTGPKAEVSSTSNHPHYFARNSML